jgi:hypothetical protein
VATATVTEPKVTTAPKVWRERPLRPWQVHVDFDVTITDDGCCALIVELRESDPWPFPDDLIGTNEYTAFIPCICFKKGETRRFRIYGDENPTNAQMGGGGREVLVPPMLGSWPKSDGPFDNTIEVYATVEVVWCNEPGCEQNQPCKGLQEGRKGFVTVGKNDSREHAKDVLIVDGKGMQEGIDLIEKAAGAALKQLPAPVTSPLPSGGKLKSELAFPAALTGDAAMAALPVLWKRVMELEARLERTPVASSDSPTTLDSPAGPEVKRSPRSPVGGEGADPNTRIFGPV